MDQKKILIIGNSFYPENSPRAFRTTELVKEFARQGHKVTVLIPKNTEHHLQFEMDFGVEIKDLGKLRYKEIDISNGGKLAVIFRRVLRRSLDFFFDFPSIQWMFKVQRALKKEKQYDLLISIAAPHPIHWGAALAYRKKRIAKTWVADCGDPFMGVSTDTFGKPFYFKYIEKYWCKKADYISVPFIGAKNGYYKEFRHKIKIIPQGFKFEDIEINSKEYKLNEIPTFAFAGGLIPGARDPKEFIKYLLSLKIPFKFILYTRSHNMISPLLKIAKGKVEVRDYVPRKELILALSKMDFVVNFNNGVPTQLPSKLIDYYLTKRPVLSLDSYNFDKKIAMEFLEGNYGNKFIFNDPEQYRIENVCQQFLSL